MKITTVAFIGHRQIKDGKEVKQKLKKVISNLIEEENAETFLFGSKSYFDALCLMVTTQLKEKFYPLIKRVYIRARDEIISELYKDYLLGIYDDTIYPYRVKGAGYRSYVVRNYIMIDMCDVVVTYFDKDYKLLKGSTSGTKLAIEYALKKNKRIINLYEY